MWSRLSPDKQVGVLILAGAVFVALAFLVGWVTGW